jgi:Tol biopolymer transport system component
MALTPGTRLGSYEIIAPIGAGGMGEVYRARDTRLQRDVAIKVLPDLFARDPERLARFEREARTLAAVNHPNIAQVYGIVDLPPEGGSHLVMELVSGEDLAQRLARAGAIPLDEAIPVAMQIAEAVAAAHEQGIIHRDLKPANVKVRDDGTVKVLDFGLAKALAPDSGSGARPPIDNSPTITSPFQMSQLGVVLGTAAYMAPEQARGKPIDKRADIWAFGCVLFEMLTGRKPFDGDDVTDVLAAIVRDEPHWSLLPADTPSAVRTLLRRCLEKDRRERLPDIGVARIELRDARHAPTARDVSAAASPRISSSSVAWTIAGVATAGLIAIAVYAGTRPAAPSADTRVFRATLLPHAALTGAPALRLRISPDGRRVAYTALDQSGKAILWIRALDSMTSQPLNGTAGATAPFWSPDSRSIAFFTDGKLKKVDASTGAVISICDATGSPPGTWNRDDVILFSAANSIMRVDASGGRPTQVTTRRPVDRAHISPFFLPDGRSFLYSVGSSEESNRGVFVSTLDGAPPVKLLDLSTNVAYANGHLLYMRDSTLMAQPFNAESRAFSGAAVPLAEEVQTNPSTGTGAFSVSDTGVLLYQSGNVAGTRLTWYDRTGKIVGTIGDPQGYRDVQLSPDGRTASMTIVGPASPAGDVWLYDVSRKLLRRFTFNEVAAAPVWTRDGRTLVYAARPGPASGARDLYRKEVSGTSGAELLLRDNTDKLPLSVAPDGTVLYRTVNSAAAGELWLLPPAGDRKPRTFQSESRIVSAAVVSPNGKWIAYCVSLADRREVFVSAFPSGAGKWQISTGGGDTPLWRQDGQELFFSSNDRLMAVDVVTTKSQFEAGAVRQLFQARFPLVTLGTRATYGTTPDGQQFLLNTWDAAAAVVPVTLVVNWPETLKK